MFVPDVVSVIIEVTGFTTDSDFEAFLVFGTITVFGDTDGEAGVVAVDCVEVDLQVVRSGKNGVTQFLDEDELITTVE